MISSEGQQTPPRRGTTARGGHDASFRAAVEGMRAGTARLSRPELTIDDEPAPRRLAPRAAAISGTVTLHDCEVGWGRFVLLFDPAGQPPWAGRFRVIAYIRAELEPDIAAEPLIAAVGWAWLTEALTAREASYMHPSGTVTRVITESFGAKHDEPVSTEFELRASWSPVVGPNGEPSLAEHVAAWGDALCSAAGLQPLPPGVAPMRSPRRTTR